MNKKLSYVLLVLSFTQSLFSESPTAKKHQKIVGSITEKGKIRSIGEHELKSMSRGIRSKVGGDCTLRCTSKLRKVTLDRNFTSYGSAELSEVTVKGVLTMYGPLQATQCSFQDVDIRCLQEDNDASSQFIDCGLKKLLIVGTESVELIDSQVESITVVTEPLKKGAITLTNTVVAGPIYFSQKGGVVFCKDTTLLQGHIVNGTVEKISS